MGELPGLLDKWHATKAAAGPASRGTQAAS